MLKSISFVTILASAACGSSVSYAPFRTAPVTRQVAADAVDVFFGAPGCPFIELGMLELQSKYSNLEESMFAMRAEAGARGADGIILIDHQDRSSDHGSASHSYSAIAISRVQPCAAAPPTQYIGQASPTATAGREPRRTSPK